MQYEKATAPRNRNRRNSPRGSARAGRNLLRHPDWPGLPPSAAGLCGAAGLCTSRARGTAGVCRAEADLSASNGRASAGLLCPAAGRLLRTPPPPRLEASASALRSLRALSLSSLTANAEGTWYRRARIENDPRFFFGEFFEAKARSRLQLFGNPVIIFGSKRLCRHS